MCYPTTMGLALILSGPAAFSDKCRVAVGPHHSIGGAAMPLYRLDIQKSDGAEFWTNRYFINADSFDGGLVVGRAIAEIERAIHVGYITFISQRVSTPVPDSPSQYLTQTLGFNGNRSYTGPVPLTVCARVELFKGPRRPDVRYFRGSCQAADFASASVWKPSYVDFIQTTYCAALLDLDGVVDKGNLPYTSARLGVNISQHQLRAGTRRKQTPVIPVS